MDRKWKAAVMDYFKIISHCIKGTERISQGLEAEFRKQIS
jgi:hypothetical protein